MNIPSHIPNKQLVRYVLEKSKTKGSGERWFIETIEPWGVTSEQVRLNLTNYKLPTHEEIEKVLKRKVSRLRWVTLVNAEVGAGQAKGWIIVDKRVFSLTYAWGGLNSKGDYHIRESYSVQIEGRGCEKFITSYVKQIVQCEGRKKCFGNLLDFFYMKTIKPYRLGDKT